VASSTTSSDPVSLEFSVSVDMSIGENNDGPVNVGWLLADDFGAVLYGPPERLSRRAHAATHAKSAARCPAVQQLDSRIFTEPCPVDLTLGFCRTDFGEPAVRQLDGPAKAVDDAALDRLIVMRPEAVWFSPERPVILMALPYIFVADEPVMLCQLPPQGHYRPDPLPGLTLGGRVPIHIWPRSIHWAFEWHEPDKPLILKRGEPLFSLLFETMPQNRPVRLVEAQRTPELMAYVASISGVVDYVNQTFSLFRDAERMRPRRLVRPVDRDA